jgi:hypothetical protein
MSLGVCLGGVLAAVAMVATEAAAQEDLGARLAARGASAEFVAQVRALVADAHSEGLPAAPIEDKALEGLAKRAPPERILPVLEQLRARLRVGRAEAVAAGLAAPPAVVVAAAAEALGRGMTGEQVRDLIRAAPGPEQAADGLVVAASLTAQGLETAAAARAVRDGYGHARGPQQLFELPSAVAELRGRGIPMSDVARRILEGGGLPLPPTAGEGRGGPPGGLPLVPPGGPPPGAGRPPDAGPPKRNQ